MLHQAVFNRRSRSTASYRRSTIDVFNPPASTLRPPRHTRTKPRLRWFIAFSFLATFLTTSGPNHLAIAQNVNPTNAKPNPTQQTASNRQLVKDRNADGNNPPLPSQHQKDLIIVLGATGTPQYAAEFKAWVNGWQNAAQAANANYQFIGDTSLFEDATDSTPAPVNQKEPNDDRDQLLESLASTVQETNTPLWLVLIGHGTYTRGVAKFNLRGPDVTASELSEKLSLLKRPITILNFSSSSGPFINELSSDDRVIVTATKNGSEQNYSRFGGFFITALTDLKSDLDHDQQISVLEAFLSASQKTEAFYASEQRLSTEHALIDDNGDQLGTPASFFRGIRAVKRTKNGTQVDGRRGSRQILNSQTRASQLTLQELDERATYEKALDQLVENKSDLSRAEYLAELEKILIPLSTLYGRAMERDGALERDAAATTRPKGISQESDAPDEP